jgi:hypothetical protein
MGKNRGMSQSEERLRESCLLEEENGLGIEE